eukprot:m.161865 g.161865  ORF g.161865 m.161865 type:complete len:870 (-) comp15192_c0_seq20:1020-3629(-)
MSELIIPATPFVEVQTLLKKEKMFAASERQAIRDLYVEINELTSQLISISRTARRIHWDCHLFLHNKIPWAEWELRNKTNLEEETEFQDAHACLSQHAQVYEIFVRALKDNPRALGKHIHAYCVTKDDDVVDNLLRSVLFSLFCNFFVPEEGKSVMELLDSLLLCEIEACVDRVDLALRGSSPFTRVATLYCKEYTPGGLTFLICALRDPVLTILGDDGLDVEMDALAIWNRLPEAKKIEFFGPNYAAFNMDKQRLTSDPQFKAHMERIFDTLLNFCAIILDSLASSVHAMPYVTRWICKRISDYLKEKGASEDQIRVAIGNLVLVRFIAPAIASPEPFGIITDTPISSTARRNLGLVSKILRDLNRGSYKVEAEPYLKTLYERLDTMGTTFLSTFFDKLVDIDSGMSGLGYAPMAVNHRGRRRVVALSVDELFHLQDFLSVLDLDESSPFSGVLQRLPNSSARPQDSGSSVVVLSLGSNDVIGGLLSEEDILRRISEKDPEGGQGADPVIQDLSQRLRVSLSDIGFPVEYKHLDLLSLLETEFAEAQVMDKAPVQAQLHTTITNIRKALPGIAKDGAKALLDRLLSEYSRRQPYISYLVATRQSLIISRELVQKSIVHLEHTINVCSKFFSMTRVRRFLEFRIDSIEKFIHEFRETELLDEKSGILSDFMDDMYEKMAADPTFADASPEELEESRTLMEKRFMCHVYQFVFFPHETAEVSNNLFHRHIAEDLQHISADHPSLQIREECRAEMPWPAAQEALLRMNAYKSPADKLSCIVQCCSSLMELLQLGGRSAGADDFFPLLVFVILKANPPDLLATIQFINFFGRSAITSGEGSYWFAQFQTAVTFIQSIDDRTEGGSPDKNPSS